MSDKSSDSDPEGRAGWSHSKDKLPAVMLPGGEPEPTLTPVALGCQVVRVPAGNLKGAAKSQFLAVILGSAKLLTIYSQSQKPP